MRLTILILCLGAAAGADGADGGKVFAEQCAVCHNGEAAARAPSPDTMKARSPEAIITALQTGAMRAQGSHLSGPERRAVAEFLSGKELSGNATGSAVGRCEARPAFSGTHPAWSGWGPGITNTHYQAAPGLAAGQVTRLKLKWALGFPDATVAWAQPGVAGGRVFVGSQNGTVYALDAKSGCIYWTFSAQGGVRTAISVDRGTVYFGDTNANAYAVSASTGEKLWARKVEDHPLARITGSPALYQGRLYVPASSYEESQGADAKYECCTFRGSVTALDAKSGRVLWKTYTIPTEPAPRGKSKAGATLWGPSGAAIWSSPTIDSKRKVLYAATGNTYSDPPQPTSDAVLALDLGTGKIRWSRQATPNDTFLSACRAPGNPNCPDKNGPDFDFGNSPILAQLLNGRDIIVIGQKSGVGFALDPDKNGAILWQYRAGVGGALGGIEWGSAVDAQHAYFPVSDIGRKEPGGLHAVDLATGERVWFTPPPEPTCGGMKPCNAAQPAAITVIPGVVFSGSNDGVLRAYSTKDGKILWEYDTNRPFATVNGVAGRGASLQGPAPVIAGGMLYVNSGYGAFGGRAGNVLLAFGVE